MSEPKSIEMGNGRMEWVKFGAVQCKRYVGRFQVEALQDKADTGLWFSEIQGNPHASQGEGITPEAAILDSIERTLSHTTKLQNAVKSLQSALSWSKEGA